jgi:hypothetical protein
LTQAEEIARGRVPVRTLDAIHVASLMVFQARAAMRLPFVTADERHREAGASAELDMIWTEWHGRRIAFSLPNDERYDDIVRSDYGDEGEVPALVCSQCGEPYFEEENVRIIQELITDVDERTEKIIAASAWLQDYGCLKNGFSREVQRHDDTRAILLKAGKHSCGDRVVSGGSKRGSRQAGVFYPTITAKTQSIAWARPGRECGFIKPDRRRRGGSGPNSNRHVGKSLLCDRDEEEVRGYRNALKLIHELGWHDGQQDPWPYVNYLLFIFKKAYKEFEDRMGQVKDARGAKTELMEQAVRRTKGDFTTAELERACPPSSIPGLRKGMYEAASKKFESTVNRFWPMFLSMIPWRSTALSRVVRPRPRSTRYFCLLRSQRSSAVGRRIFAPKSIWAGTRGVGRLEWIRI